MERPNVGGPGFRADPALSAAIEDALRFAAARLESTIRDAETRYPADYASHYPVATISSGPEVGAWVYAASTDWRSGFFPGLLWQMHAETDDPEWAKRAEAWMAGIEPLRTRPIDHDLGYRFCASFGNACLSPGGAAAETLLTAAATLDLRFGQAGIPVGALRSKDDEPPGSTYPVLTDDVMNQCLFWMAWDLSGRPATGAAKTWYAHAVTQSGTIMAENVRPDGSTYNAVEHNDGTHGTPPDGRVRTKLTLQGFAPESTWSRGQAWAIYGFVMAYRNTRDDASASPTRFLETARRAADYFVSHLPDRYDADVYNHVPGDFVPPADFDAALGEPDGPYSTHREGTRAYTRRDSAAAAIAASALLELATLVDGPGQRSAYFGAAEDILRSLLTFRGPDGELAYLAKGSVHRGLLAGATFAWDEKQDTISLMPGDYYFVEAMRRYRALTAAGPAC